MLSRTVLIASLALVLLVPVSTALADPPPHAPAHGYRGKHSKHPKSREVETRHPDPAPRSGVQIVFDSERGVYVGIGLPNVFFHEGTYYRRHEGRWQASPTGEGDWRRRFSFRVPEEIVAAAKRGDHQPGPAAAGPGDE